MNILLLTIAPKKSQKMIRDLALELTKQQNNVFIVCPSDGENPTSRRFIKIDEIFYLFVNSGYSVGKVGFIKKVYNMLSVDGYFKRSLKRISKNLEFDLILYSTPPITLVNTIEWAKKYFNAQSYLMLKDIFPQNAVDLGMMKKTGLTGLIYKFFRNKEKKLYMLSDFIGCMSEGNRKYVLEHNNEIRSDSVGICVNSYKEEPIKKVNVNSVREKYGIPVDRVVFLYGGNLGKPQGLDYFVEVLKDNINKPDRFFVICGSGKEQNKVVSFIEEYKPLNVIYMKNLNPDDFDILTCACDVGMVFLDNRFTIPNFPSRMLSIMLNGKPILAATDIATDVNEMIEDGDLGWWCESTRIEPMRKYIDDICKNPEIISEKGSNARRYFESHYTSEISCDQILSSLEN